MRSCPLLRIGAALLSVVTGVHFALAVEAETKPPNRMQTGVATFRVVTAFRTQIHQCWKASIAAKTYRGAIPRLQLALNRDGSLSSEPVLLNSSDEPLFYEIAQSAKRAVSRCVPLKVSPEGAEHYERWKLLIINFNPAESPNTGSSPKIAPMPRSICTNSGRYAAR